MIHKQYALYSVGPQKGMVCLFKMIVTAIATMFYMNIAVHAADTFKWSNVCMGGGGFVSAIITCPTEKNLIFARTDVGGAYRWNNDTQAWIPLIDWVLPDQTSYYGVESMAVDPQSPNKVYISAGTTYWKGGTAVLRSNDYGATWSFTIVDSLWVSNGNGMGRQTGEKLAVDPNNGDILFCGTRTKGLFKSIDGGVRWQKVASLTIPSSDNGISFVLFDKTSGTKGSATPTIYAGSSNSGENLFVSKDGGSTWSTITGAPSGFMPSRCVISNDGSTLYLTYGNGPGPWTPSGNAKGYLFKYDIGAKQFTDISPQDFHSTVQWGQDDPYYGMYGGVSIDKSNPKHILVSTMNAWKKQYWECNGDKLFLSEDGGVTWTDLFDKGRNTMDENGYGWIKDHAIHWAGSIEIDPFNPSRAFVSSGNGIFMTEDLSASTTSTWKFMVRGLEETVPLDIVSIPGGPALSVVMDYDGFYHSNIGQPPTSRHTPSIGHNTDIDFAKQKPNVVVRVGGNEKMDTVKDYVFPLWYSLDTGKTWTKFVTHIGVVQNYQGKVAISSDGKVVLWQPQEKGVVYRTEDWGANWTTVAGISSQKCFPTADPVNSDVFYAFSGGILKSTDKGKTFTKASTRGFDWTTDMQVTPGVSGHIWVAGFAWDGINGGFLARSTDGGVTFVDVDPEKDSLKYSQKVQHSEAVGFGKAAPGASYPAIYIYGTVGGVKGIFQSTDEAKTWITIDDKEHQYGSLANGNFVRGDMNTFGVVYRSTAGRGIAARMPVAWTGINVQDLRNRTAAKRQDIAYFNNVLAFAADKKNNLTIQITSLNGRVFFRKSFVEPASINIESIVKANGFYVVSVLNNNKTSVFSKLVALIK